MKSLRSRFARSIFTILCATILILTPISASAQWTDFVALVQRILSYIPEAATWLATDGTWVKEYFLDYVEKGIAVQLEQEIISSTRNWARNGFDGQPSFVENPKDLILNTEENEAQVFRQQVTNALATICSPYQTRVQTRVVNSAINRAETSARSTQATARITKCNLETLVTSGVLQNYYAPGGFEQEG